jgi:hypothetical protein
MKFNRLIEKRWELGLIEGGYETVFNNKKFKVHWVKNHERSKDL